MPAGTGVWVVKTPPGPHRLDGLGERQAAVDQLADPLEAEEAGVALVGVEHLRVEAEGPQRPHAADAEQDLLAEAVLGVAAVEPVGDGAGLGRVVVDVGVEQVQRDAADVGPPDLRLRAARRPGRPRRCTPSQRVEGQRVGVEVGVALLLPAVDVELLAEVARGGRSRPTPTSGTPRSLDALRWSPASTPRPPEYCGSASVMPNSGEK